MIDRATDQRDARPQRRLRRLPAPLVAVAVVVVVTVSLRGGEVEEQQAPPPVEPRVVSDAEFCAAYEEMNIAYGRFMASPSRRTTRILKDAAAVVGGLASGTEMADRAQAGARFLTGLITDLHDDADKADVAAFDEGATIDDTANARALGEFVAGACVTPAPGVPR